MSVKADITRLSFAIIHHNYAAPHTIQLKTTNFQSLFKLLSILIPLCVCVCVCTLSLCSTVTACGVAAFCNWA